MKKLTKIIILSLFSLSLMAFVSMNLPGGIKLFSGNASILKGEKEICLKYDYSDMKVGGKTEEAYIDEKVKEKNKKEPGSGEKFKEEWFKNRTEKYQPKFEDLLNKYIADGGVSVGEKYTSAKYTIILKTTFTEPGFNIGIKSKPALINVEILIVETADNTIVKSKLTMDKVPGTPVYDTGLRITEAYAKCGKSLGAYLKKNAYGK